MNKTLGENIARLRKERSMTQEELANELNISYQAVSKWENGISSPDISNIKQLAQFFGVSIDSLFGMTLAQEEAYPDFQGNALPASEETAENREAIEPAFDGGYEENCDSVNANLPWEDDNTLRAVLFRGRSLVSAEELKKGLFPKSVTLEYSGEALNVFSFFDVRCDNVAGNVEAGGDVSCDAVGGFVSAQGDVSCDDVGEAVHCGGDVSCDNVGGDVRAGSDVNCGEVGGSVSAGGDVSCEDVGGSVAAGGDVNCDDVGGVFVSSGGERGARRNKSTDADAISDMVDGILRQTKESIETALSGIKGRQEK